MRYIVLFGALIVAPLILVAQGPPCWDNLPPREKYASRHIVTGSNGPFSPYDKETTYMLFADGVTVSTKLVDGDSFLRVEVTVTNCSARPVKINPQDFSLSKADARGDIKLASLDPTHYVRYPKTGKAYLPLIPESLAYGRIGAYQLFFERDGQAKSIDMLQSNYRLALTVPIEGWQFEFAFPRKRQ